MILKGKQIIWIFICLIYSIDLIAITTKDQDIFSESPEKKINKIISKSNESFISQIENKETIAKQFGQDNHDFQAEILLFDSTIRKSVLVSDYKGKYFMLGSGVGLSYGGLGVRAQWRWGDIQGFGIHLGMGYSFVDKLFKSGGVKYFPYKNIYIGAQFGNTGYLKISMNNYVEEYYVAGFSYMVGGDWVWGSKIGYGFNFGFGITNNIFGLTNNIDDSVISKYQPALDIAFLIRF